MWLLLMHKEWRSKLSLLIEELNEKDQKPLKWNKGQRLSVGVVLFLEAIKRISFTKELEVEGMTDDAQSCLR